MNDAGRYFYCIKYKKLIILLNQKIVFFLISFDIPDLFVSLWLQPMLVLQLFHELIKITICCFRISQNIAQ